MTTNIGTKMIPGSRRKPERLWSLVTNHQNMLYMLAAGMVMGPAGFRRKYYSDPLSDYPGWIPLFRDKVKIPADALNQATSERKHLLPCIASFDLSDLRGPVLMLSRDGRKRKITSPSAKRSKDDIALLVRAPLPMTMLFSINFRSTEDMQAFGNFANDVSNVDLLSHRVDIAESLFITDAEVVWPTPQYTSQPVTDRFAFKDCDDNYPAYGLAFGGTLAMLYYTANRNDLSLAAFRLITGVACEKDNDLVESDSILSELPNWMDGGKISGQADNRARLFWGVVQSLVTVREEETKQTPVDLALAYLENQLEQLKETELRQRLERLIADMRGILGFGGGTISELLERHKGSLSRPLLLFCLREHCAELLEFSHPLLNDAEYLLAGILFGVRESWLQLPKELRNPDMSAYVSFRMADAEHRKQGDKLIMDAPPRPKPLRELFTSQLGEWNSMQKDTALKLSKNCNWNDCIQTRITMAEGDFPERIEPNGLEIVIPGRVTVTEEVDKAKFLSRLGQWPLINTEIESEVRKKIASLQGIGEKANRNGSSCG